MADSTKAPADWSMAMTKRLFTVLLEEVVLGKRADTGFKVTSYKRALKEVNFELDSSGKQPLLVLKQVKTKVTNLKKDNDLFMVVRGFSGVGWEEREDGTCEVSAPSDVWDRIIRGYPKAKKYKKKGLEFFLQLQELFFGSRATGNYSQTPSQLLNRDQAFNSPLKEDTNTDTTVTLHGSATNTENQNHNYLENKSDLDSSQLESSQILSSRTKRPAENFENSLPSASTKRHVRERKSAGKELANSIVELKATAIDLHWRGNKIERAITLIQDEYPELSVEDMVYAFDIFIDVRKAEMFSVMKKGDSRNVWIQKEIDQIRNKAE